MSRSNVRSIFDDDDDEELESLKGPRKTWTKEDALSRQAKNIDELSEHVSAVSHMTGMIYEQIVQGNRDLDAIEQGMDTNATRLEQITSRTKKMVDKAGGPRYCCIIVTLSIIAFVLFLLVLYT